MRLVFGVGINDADYVVQPNVDGKQVSCQYYTRWKDMLRRCYDKVRMAKYPTYSDCTICAEWLIFSNFKSWMELQNWKGNHLDKDLLVAGNKMYSPETCMFVSPLVNTFLLESDSIRGEYPIGVTFSKKASKYSAECKNLGGKRIWIGYYFTPEEASFAYREVKYKLALQLAAIQPDPRVSRALIERYKI